VIFQVVTLFPERYHDYVKTGLPQKALRKGLFQIVPVHLRDFADPGRGGRVDDVPYGGGPGMLVEVGPIDRALKSLPQKFPAILFTPRGKVLNQSMVQRYATYPGLTLVSGYYEGVDERVAEHLVDECVSLGDFVLGSGDLAALCCIEAVSRILPGYMGSAESGVEESSGPDGLLEYPQYTRPRVYGEWSVPEVLLSGDHGRIRQWRREQQELITRERNYHERR
jgi:tRNA (guanine37-N1)-methyltransferase